MSRKIQKPRFRRTSLKSKPGIITLIASMGTMMSISYFYLLALAR